MAPWASTMMDLLWQSAIAVIPLALLVMALCQFLPAKPSTRHSLFLLVLAWLVVAPFLPAMRPTPIEPATLVTRAMPVASAAVDSLLTDAARSDVRDEFLKRDSAIKLDRPRSFLEGGLAAELELRPMAAPSSQSALPAVGGLKRTVGLDEYPGVARLAPSPGSSGLPSRFSSTPPIQRRVVLGRSPSPRFVRGPGPGQLSLLPTSERVQTPKAMSDLDAPRTAFHKEPDDARIEASGDDRRAPSTRLSWAAGRNAPRETSSGRAEDSPALKDRVASPLSIGVATASGIDAADAPPGFWHLWAVGLADVRDAVGRLPKIPWSVWLGGSGLFLAVVVTRLGLFYRRLGRARPAPPELTRLVAEIARSFELKRVPECLIVRDCLSPMIWCGRRARLLIPTGLWSELDDTGRRAILCHELAHLRRRDHWVCWVEIAVAALYWWHPLLWWVRRRLREEAELCCDAWVTWLMPQGRRAYAEALLSTKQYVARGAGIEPALGLGVTTARAERFARRIRMVMTESKRPRMSISGLALVMLIAGMGWVATPARSCPPEEQQRVARERERVERAAERQEQQRERQQERKQERKTRQKKQTKKTRSLTETTPDTSFEQFYSTLTPATPMDVFLASDDDDDLEDRLDRLEEQLAKLSMQLERIGSGGALLSRAWGEAEAGNLIRTRQGLVGRRSFFTPTSDGDDETISRSYELSEGKLRELTALMVRSDVPIIVSPGDDSIEVRATRAQHATFRAFVNMIAPESATGDTPLVGGILGRVPGTNQLYVRAPKALRAPKAPKAPKAKKAPKAPKAPKRRSGGRSISVPRTPETQADADDNVREYRLSEGKLEALTELMIRPDVPVLVSPGGNAIGVHGNRKLQKMFAAFVNLLEPEDEDDISEGEQIDRSYKLSEGKLDALSNLMIRPDVPVRVRPGDGEITVFGNKKTHKAFKAFIKAIEPKKEGSGRRGAARTTLGVVGVGGDAHPVVDVVGHAVGSGHGHDAPHADEVGHGEHSGANAAPASKADDAAGRIASNR